MAATLEVVEISNTKTQMLNPRYGYRPEFTTILERGCFKTPVVKMYRGEGLSGPPVLEYKGNQLKFKGIMMSENEIIFPARCCAE